MVELDPQSYLIKLLVPEGALQPVGRPAAPTPRDEPMPTEVPTPPVQTWLAGCIVHHDLPTRSVHKDQWPPVPSSIGLWQCDQPGTVRRPRTPRGNQSLPPDHLCARRHTTRTGPESDHLGWPWHLASGIGGSEGSTGSRPSWDGLARVWLPACHHRTACQPQREPPEEKAGERSPPCWPRTAGEMVSPLNIVLTSSLTYICR